MVDGIPVDFAILAPVPAEHLEHGERACQDTGYVSFGTNKWEIFREIDELRGDHRVPVLIYPSQAEDHDPKYCVEWFAEYIGHVDSHTEKRRDELNGHRPASTMGSKFDDATYWAVYWRLANLARLPEARREKIGQFVLYKAGLRRVDAAPRGPELIRRPNWL